MAVTTGARMAHALLTRLDREGKLDEALRCEILGGELVIRGFPQEPHQEVVHVLLDHFRAWVRQHGGQALGGLGIEIGDRLLGPDVAFVGPERVDELDEDGFHVPPDLVVEVTSPGTRSLDLVVKPEVYADIGVPEYWVVDLSERRVVVHRLAETGGYDATEHATGTLATEQAPGLAIRLVELLAEA